jgi:hypothetical protein
VAGEFVEKVNLRKKSSKKVSFSGGFWAFFEQKQVVFIAENSFSTASDATERRIKVG